jgi:MFS family permease
MLTEAVRKTKFHYLYWAVFIFAISDALFAYAQSTFLNQYFGLETVGFIFFAAYFFCFFAVNHYPNLISRYSNLKMAFFTIVLRIACYIIFLISTNIYIVALTFILFIISLVLTFINLDVFLEAFTQNVKTGRVRGIFFTIYNLGYLLSPFLAGEILNYFNFKLLISIPLILNLPLFFILYSGFKDFTNHYERRHFEIGKTIMEVLKNHDLRKIFIISFLLQFFYAIEVIYAPLYLNQIIGLNWEQLGLIFTFILIPFVIIQMPAGYLADKYIGEKEMLFIGMLLMAITSIIMGFITGINLIFWGIILFISRIGASLVEIMRETYFFKKVDVGNLNLINAFRSTIPFAFLLAPLLFIITITYSQFNYIFAILGVILLAGLYPILTLKDTK